MSEQEYRVRECVHRAEGAAGSYYRGSAYVKQLQRLRTEAAVRFASKVTPFFWSDAPHILVWLCEDCACEIGLRESETNAA
ncbi:MAG TPA: hypothetical protein VFA21_05815 [Pyrinomonadaceae bacterium]|jgi:hypothetical protein|nr:hypothetical protein [Pyrinomonadaceae bacterium]